MVTKKNYDAIQVDAARSVMLELVRLLAEYRDDIVVVGGWVPALLIPQDRKPHIGSTDVDLALNHRTLTGPGYKTICRLLEGRGYAQDKKQPFIFWRTVEVGDKKIAVEVDLLAGEYGVTRVFIGQERLGEHERNLVAMDSVFIVIAAALVARPR